MKQWRFAPTYQLGTTDQLILTINIQYLTT